jgi:hypothetical protein
MPPNRILKFIIFIAALSVSVLVLIQINQNYDDDRPLSSRISDHALRMHNHLRNLISNDEKDEDVGRVPFFDQSQGVKVGKKDWHDHEFMDYEAHRKGLGEQGVRVVDPEVFDEPLRKAIYAANGYDGYLSDRVSLFRSVPDLRHPE